MCNCETKLTMSYKSLNDTSSKFYLEGRKSFLKNKREKNLISEEMFSQAMGFIEKKEIFDIIECVQCKEIVDINNTSEYVQLMKKSVEFFELDSVKKENEKDSLINKEDSGKLKKPKKVKEPSREGKQKRVISDEVREARRQRMKKMWEERRKNK